MTYLTNQSNTYWYYQFLKLIPCFMFNPIKLIAELYFKTWFSLITIEDRKFESVRIIYWLQCLNAHFRVRQCLNMLDSMSQSSLSDFTSILLPKTNSLFSLYLPFWLFSAPFLLEISWKCVFFLEVFEIRQRLDEGFSNSLSPLRLRWRRGKTAQIRRMRCRTSYILDREPRPW